MATLDDARRIALSLPQTDERVSRGCAAWHVGGGRSFVRERPFTKADARRDGDPPTGDLLGVRTADQAEKAALLAAGDEWILTISHFDGYDAVLVRLEAVPEDRLRELIVGAWYAVAPPAVAAAHPALN